MTACLATTRPTRKPELVTAVCELGFEGVVAKNHSSAYKPGERGWLKIKNASPDRC
jgi:ATP-dependent DNA ligase